MPQDTTVKQLIVNQLSKEQYKQAKLDNMLSDTEIYIITDDYHYTESEIQTLLATKQDKLTTSGKINIDENNVISVDLSDYDSTLGSSLEYENSVLTLVSKDGKVLSNVTIKSTPDVDDTTIHLNNGEQLEVIGNVTKDGTTKYDWIGTKEEYEQGLSSGLITNTTTCFITDDEQDLISGGDILIPTKLSQFANDTNFVNSEILNNFIATKVDKIEGKSLIDDTEIVRLSGVNNYDDTEIKQFLNNKVDKIDGKSLIDDTEIVRLSGINNYDDTSIVNNITSLQLNKSNTSLNNLTPEGEKHFLNKSQITNCITEIPQDIKLELNNGVLTLKAGSKVYVPNGFESDGVTPKFDYVTIESDVVKDTNSATSTAGQIRLIFYSPSLNELQIQINSATRTAAAPSGIGELTYRTDLNKAVYYYLGNVIEETCTLPLGLCVSSTTAIADTISQVFNGFGYIGSTVFVTKGVKGLIPNGRNEDGTLRNIEFTVGKVLVNNKQSDWTQTQIQLIRQDSLDGLADYDCYYNQQRNLVLRKETNIEMNACIWGIADLTNGVISNFNPKLPFRAVDYSDKSEVSSWSFPSNKYVNLALGASGTVYTAPANGWFNGRFEYTAGGHYQVNTGLLTLVERMEQGTNQMTFLVPIKKGELFGFNYANLLTRDYTFFRFIYAESET